MAFPPAQFLSSLPAPPPRDDIPTTSSQSEKEYFKGSILPVVNVPYVLDLNLSPPGLATDSSPSPPNTSNALDEHACASILCDLITQETTTVRNEFLCGPMQISADTMKAKKPHIPSTRLTFDKKLIELCNTHPHVVTLLKPLSSELMDVLSRLHRLNRGGPSHHLHVYRILNEPVMLQLLGLRHRRSLTRTFRKWGLRSVPGGRSRYLDHYLFAPTLKLTYECGRGGPSRPRRPRHASPASSVTEDEIHAAEDESGGSGGQHVHGSSVGNTQVDESDVGGSDGCFGWRKP